MTNAFAPPVDPLAYPEPPSEADLHPLLATASAQRTVERNAKVVDPLIPPRTRLLTGARLIAGNQGSDRDTYTAWRQDRSQPTPPRAGTDPKQGAILAANDSHERGKVLGGDKAGAWLEATKPDPIDLARFARAPKTGRASELWDKLPSGLDDDEAFKLSEMVAKTGQILDDFDDDLTVGGGKVVEVGDRVRVHWDSEPAPGALTALGLDSLPADGFDGDTEAGFDVLVGDDIVVAAPVESQTLLRRAFPAASQGGAPRWLSVQPATVRGLMRAVDSAGTDPSAHVSVHLSGHPGLAPYDSLTFTTSDTPARAERFRALGAEHVGRGLVAVPRYARRTVTLDDLTDAPTADKLLDETAWAIVEPSDAPSFGGVDQIPARIDGRDLVMLFGIGPDEAAEMASGFAYVNDGIAIESGYDGLEPFEDEPAWFELDLRDGSTYRFPVGREEALLYPERTQKAVNRWQIAQPNRKQLEGLATHLETLGADDVAAYVTGQAGSGFTEAREVLWGDGTGSVASSRVKGLRSGPNVIPVWLRDAGSLPDDSDSGADVLDTSEAEAAAEQVGPNWRYDARGYPDLAETVRWGHALGQKYGYHRVEILTDRGRMELA